MERANAAATIAMISCRLHLKDPRSGLRNKLLAHLTRRHVNEFRDRMAAWLGGEHLPPHHFGAEAISDHASTMAAVSPTAAQGVRIQFQVPAGIDVQKRRVPFGRRESRALIETRAKISKRI